MVDGASGQTSSKLPSDATSQSVEAGENEQKLPRWQKWSMFGRWLGRDEQSSSLDSKPDNDGPRPSLGRRLSRIVVPGLPRPATFRRQNSERRERLSPVDPSVDERRTVSVDRRRTLSARPALLPTSAISKLPASEGPTPDDGSSSDLPTKPGGDHDTSPEKDHSRDPPPPRPSPPPPEAAPDEDRASEASVQDKVADQLALELEVKWILNLSMRFRDRTPREKFFVTYAEQPNRWRRVTISCDYRDAPADSLENDLQSLDSQREKSERIYESIHASVPEIHFFDTVTNLKLETKDDRLHVHVTEDINEIIPYPPIHAVKHLKCAMYSESEVEFDSHLSGFVYKVKVDGLVCIKKEIPGPDSVEEFLYEINALHALTGANNVIEFQALIVDEDRKVVKGLLISLAEYGALVDLLFEMKDCLVWATRERWAKHIVQGLAEIHEAGFVQGDFTLSNIVVNDREEAKIIDINRRGCPVGWEPPEITKLIASSQRISMYIGVKSDLFQLGQTGRQGPPPAIPPPGPLRPEIPPPGPRAPPPPPPGSATNSELLRDLSAGDRHPLPRPASIDIPFDGPGSYMVPRRGCQPPLPTSHPHTGDGPPGSRASSPAPSDADDDQEPQLVPRSPRGALAWAHVELGGSPFLVQKSELDCVAAEAAAAHGDAGRWVGEVERGFRHADSGLADMDGDVDGGMDLDIAGVGGHETLADYHFEGEEEGLGLDTGEREEGRGGPDQAL
ncbi:MAG: kinase domain-containing protein [Lasallia pustulata]|uniref:Kinase domain-containing protein n=1 Tax=Lasallia pustulata TaxID=136370 RepID=A0A5M8PYE9_9LECA|nr:MAG: kinase domain-containing protein [Lasallia pustulata]